LRPSKWSRDQTTIPEIYFFAPSREGNAMITRSEVDKIPIDACHRPCVLVQFHRRDGPKARTRLLTLRRSKSLEYSLWARGRVKIRSGIYHYGADSPSSVCSGYLGGSNSRLLLTIIAGLVTCHHEGDFLQFFCFVV
jgi:hypothetical protein